MASPTRAEADRLAMFEERIGYSFNDRRLLEEALTHSSATAAAGRAARSARRHSNERLEFLGDRVLGLVAAHRLFTAFPREAEGALDRRHDAIVRRETLATIAGEIGLGEWLTMARAEDDTGGRRNEGILADACEALIGAIYLDGGLAAAERFIEARWGKRLTEMRAPPRDPKSSLQEWAQARGLEPPVYRTVSAIGPSHAPVFTIEASLGETGSARAEARSKRAAEQAAAEDLLRQVRNRTDQS